MKELVFTLLMIITPIIAWGHPAMASMLPLAVEWRKAAWILWLVVFLIGTLMFRQAYFEKGFFQVKPLSEENPFSLIALGYFAATLGASIVTFGFWLARRPEQSRSISWLYRLTVVFASYLPVILTLMIALSLRR
jgi:dolichyl-phosphate-mannose--protein O-mannosyl transferase